MQVIVQGLLTTYIRLGKGKQVVLLHGWGDSAAGWAEFASHLAKRYEVIVPDLPGFGGSQLPPTAWGLDEYAGFVKDFVQKLQLKPYGFIGHSNGGAILVRGMGGGVLEAKKLVLLASAGIRNEYKGRNKALRMITKTGKVLATPLPAGVKKKLQRKVYATIGSDMLVAEHLQETFKRVVTDDVRSDAARIHVPTLLLYGKNDADTPIRFGEIFHEVIDGSTLEVLPRAEHFLHLEDQAMVIRLTEEFLE